MGEEKKDSMDKKKLTYEVPKLVKLIMDDGAGLCSPGSGDTTSCNSGGAAFGTCEDGSGVGPALPSL